jgi:ATP-dependent Lon protease
VALVSAFTATPVCHTVAMSGEITLHGQVLPVGGVKEKILAAKRAGMPCIVLPHGNRQDLEGFPARLRRGLRCVFAENMEEVLAVALAPATTSVPPPTATA